MISVLYVDDEVDLLELGQHFLMLTGEFEVAISPSARASLASFSNGHPLPDAVVSDYQMPGMDGIAFLKAVREQFGDLPFILFTGRGREEVVIEAINNGADFYLQKGGEPKAQYAELAQKLRQAVRRRHAEQDLQQSEARYRSIVNDQTELIVRFTLDGTITFVNDAYRSHFMPMLGLGEVVGQKIGSINQRGDFELVDGFLGSLTPENPVGEMERSSTTVDGRSVRHRWIVRALFGTDGTITEFQVVGRDVTEQKVAEQDLRESEERFAAFMDHLPFSAFIKDDRLATLYVNQQTVRTFGDGGRTGPPSPYRFPAMVEERVREECLAVLDTGYHKTVEPLRIADGDERTFETHTFRIDRDDQSPLVGGFAIDVTEQREAALALAESESRLRSFIEATWEVVSLIDEDGTVLEWNPAAERASGVGRAEALGLPIWDLTFRMLPRERRTAEGRTALAESMRAMLRTGVPVFDSPRVIEAELPDGTRIVTRQTLFPIRTKQGFRFGMVAQDITEVVRAEAAVRESEARYRDLADLLPQIVFEVDPDLRITYANRYARAVLGLTDDDFEQGISTLDVIDPSQHERLIDGLRGLLDGEAPQPGEFTIVRRGGAALPVLIYSAPIFRDRTFAGYRGVIVDISARKEMEDALQQSRQQLEDAMDLAHLARWEYDLRLGRFVFDDRFFALFGTSAEREGGYAIPVETYAREFVHPDDRDAVADEMAKALRSTGPEYVSRREHRIVRRDGEVRDVLTHIRVVRDEQGRTFRVDGTLQDRTEQKRAEEGFRESERRFRAIVETSPNMIWEIDLEGRFRYISPMVLPLMGYRPEEVIGRSIAELIPAQGRSLAMAALAGHVAAGQVDASIVVPARHRDGRELFLEIHSSVIAADGRPSCLRGVAVDITERKRYEEALRFANHKLGLLSGITRHDVLNKTSAIHGFLELARGRTDDPETLRLLDRVGSSALAIREQMEFTRTYEALGTRDAEWIDLETVMPRTHLPPTIALRTDLKGCAVFADPMLEQVFVNLLDNSVLHGERVTTCRVSVRRDGDRTVIVWEDDGVGIPADEKALVFERGFGRHSGLGMFLSREILSLTGIAIAETGEPGRGVRFEITVPEKGSRCPDSSRPDARS
jgi:PAS domain S-box-containing protein